MPLLIYNFVIVIFEVSTKKFQYDFNYRQYIVVKNVGFRMKKKKPWIQVLALPLLLAMKPKQVLTFLRLAFFSYKMQDCIRTNYIEL